MRVGAKAAGRQFVIAFPQHQRTLGPAAARLYVTSSSWYPVHVDISLPGHVTGLLWPPSQAPPFTGRSYNLLNNGDTVELELPSPVHLQGTSIENKGKTRIKACQCLHDSRQRASTLSLTVGIRNSVTKPLAIAAQRLTSSAMRSVGCSHLP